MAQILSPGGVKPTQWNFDPALVEPRWRWVWQDIGCHTAVWEGGGPPFAWTRFSGRKATSYVPGAAAEWSSGPIGRSIEIDASATVTADELTTPALDLLQGGETAITMVALMRRTGTNGQINSDILGNGLIAADLVTIQSRSSTEANFRLSISGTESATAALTIPLDTDVALVGKWRSGGNQVLRVWDVGSGALLSEDVVSPAGGSLSLDSNIWSMGIMGDRARAIDGHWHGTYTWPRYIPDAQERELVADPFGPFRPARRRRVFVAAAAPAGPAMAGGVPSHQHVHNPTRNVTVFL